MDFNDTPEERHREQVRAWLAENAPTEHRTLRAIGDLHDLEHAKAWQKLKAQAGYAQIAWPKEWGGGGGTTIQSIIFNQEEIKAGVMLSTPFCNRSRHVYSNNYGGRRRGNEEALRRPRHTRTKSGASSFPNPRVVLTLPRSVHVRCAMAMVHFRPENLDVGRAL